MRAAASERPQHGVASALVHTCHPCFYPSRWLWLIPYRAHDPGALTQEKRTGVWLLRHVTGHVAEIVVHSAHAGVHGRAFWTLEGEHAGAGLDLRHAAIVVHRVSTTLAH